MCGLGGFVNVQNPEQRAKLVIGLGEGIDTRGGDACGYLTTGPATLRYGRRVGEWRDASQRFLEAASSGPTALLHARFATMANAFEVSAAHPFAIRRPHVRSTERMVLWGAHNGMCYDAEDSAARYARPYTVDSREVFELLADGKHAEIGKLAGWGVLTWIYNREREAIRLCRVSEQSDLEIVRTTCGAIVYASTGRILANALAWADMQAEHAFADLPVGVTYAARVVDGKACLDATREPTLRFADPWADYIPLDDSEIGLSISAFPGEVDAEDWDADDLRNALDEDDFDRAAFLRWLGKDEPREVRTGNETEWLRTADGQALIERQKGSGR